jgi:hypothetical protein
MKLQKLLFYVVCTVVLSGAFSLVGRAETIYGLAAPNSTGTATVTNLVSFDSATPGTILTTVPITGVLSGQVLQSIDFRPATNQLYAASITPGQTTGQLYTFNLATGALTPVGSGFTLGAPATPFGSSTNYIEIEFNPITDQIRLLTGANLDGSQNPVANNYRLSPTTGAIIATDTHLDYVMGDPNGGNIGYIIVASAYSNPAGGQTTLYAFDRSNDSFLRIGAVGGAAPNTPESGRMFTVLKPAGTFTVGSAIGMDVGPGTPSGTLYMSHSNGFYSVNTTTGAQTLIGNYPAGTHIADFSVLRATTAGGVTVSGRLLTSDRGRNGLVNATVILTNARGESVTTVSRKGGAFSFNDVESGQNYLLTVQSKGYSFEPKPIQVFDSVTEITLVGQRSSRGGER